MKSNKSDTRMLEAMLVLISVVLTCVLHALTGYRIIVLNLFYLPVALAAFYLGRYRAGVLAFFSVVVAWGNPPWDPEQSWLEDQIHHAQPNAVIADFGGLVGIDIWDGPLTPFADPEKTARGLAHHHHSLAGGLAMGIVIAAFLFAALVYYYRVLEPEDALAQFPAVHRFLQHKWYFDEAYSALLVRPSPRVCPTSTGKRISPSCGNGLYPSLLPVFRPRFESRALNSGFGFDASGHCFFIPIAVRPPGGHRTGVSA